MGINKLSVLVIILFICVAAWSANTINSNTSSSTSLNNSDRAVINGIKTVGTGGDYPTLTAAIAAFNAATSITGATEFRLLNTLYSASETFPLIINQIPGMSATNTLTIKPAPGVTGILISGNNAAEILNLHGADFVIVDGSNNGTSSQDLTISNSNSTGVSILLDGDASNDVIKNCQVVGSSSGNAVVYISTTLAGNGNSILACTVHDGVAKPSMGIYIWGQFNGSQTVRNCTVYNTSGAGIELWNQISTGVIIDNNTIYDFGLNGIYLNGSINAVVTSNNIYDTIVSTQAYTGGIYLYLSPGANISKNHIHNLKASTSADLYGIRELNSTLTNTTTIANNEIYLESDVTSTSGTVYGIFQATGTQTSTNLYYNSVLIGGAGVTGANNSYAFCKLSLSGAIRFKDNVFVNQRSNGTGTGKHYAISMQNTDYTVFECDYNDYRASGTGGYLGQWLTDDKSTLAAWQAVTAMDTHSLNVDPLFAFGSYYLYPGGASTIIHAGNPIVGITDDIKGSPRNATTPSMGAYEYIASALPNPAVLVSPGNGSINQLLNISLNWATGGGSPTSFILNFGTNNPPNNIVNNQNLGNVFTYTPTSLLYSTTYYWQIIPTNAGGNAVNCPVWSFSTLTVPTAAINPSPTNGAINQFLNVQMGWADGAGLPTSFILNFGTNNPPTNIVNNSNLGHVYTYVPVSLLANTIYYWQIIPVNQAGNAVNCPIWSFTTIPPPSPVVNPSPANGAVNQSINVSLGWVEGGGLSTSFILNFGTNNPPTNIANNSNIGHVYGYTPATLLPSTTYYWQIIPTGPAGNAINCPIWSFSTIGLPLAAMNPVPVNGAINQLLNLTLSWNYGKSPATSSLLNFGTNNPPTNIAHNVNLGLVSSYTPATLQPGTTYYWQIIPTNAAGNAINCPIWSFSTGGIPLAATNPYPADNARKVHKNVTLSWSAVIGATSYDVYFGSTLPSTPNANVTLASWTPPRLNTSTFYYWKVVPKNAVGSAINCPTWSFATVGNTNHAPNNVALGFTGSGRVITWEAVDGAISYKVYGAVNGSFDNAVWHYLGQVYTNSFTDTRPDSVNYFYRITTISDDDQ